MSEGKKSPWGKAYKNTYNVIKGGGGGVYSDYKCISKKLIKINNEKRPGWGEKRKRDSFSFEKILQKEIKKSQKLALVVKPVS